MDTINARTTPVTRNLRSLFKEPLPQEPMIVHVTEDEWKTLSDGIRISKRKVGEDAKGVFVIPSPYGGQLLFFTCAAGSAEGLACIPEIVRSDGMIGFGGGCFCVRGKDVVEKPIESRPESCSLGISPTGGFTCTGRCSTGKRCSLVSVTLFGGRKFVTCQC
jgi:hypothetical protein